MGQILTLLGNLHQAPKPAPASSHISREDHLAVLNHGNALFSFLPTAFWKFYILPLQTLKDGCHVLAFRAVSFLSLEIHRPRSVDL